MRRREIRIIAAAVTAASLALFDPAAAIADPIAAALSQAYMGSPTLNAERARQRATDEAVPQALSGWRPTVSVVGDAGIAQNDSSIMKPATTYPAGVSITLSQPIFRGFRTVSGTARAEALVNAGRQNLLAVEQQVLLDAATAYMNVIRDRNVLKLRQTNVEVLIEQLRASETRFSVGEITRTDVAQSRARLALSRSQLSVAEANLAASVANYLRVIGSRPGTLRFPQLSKATPKSLDLALAMSERINPVILAAAFDEEAATHNIDLVAGELLPELTLNAQYSFNFIGNGGALNGGAGSGTGGGGPKDTWNDTATIFGQVAVPIYEGGLTYSRVREAKQLASQRRLQVLDVRRQVREQVTNAWNVLKASEAVIASTRIQVKANRLALEGVRTESLVGSRTTLDVLDAETDLVESQVLLATAERDRIVAAYQLIAAVGRMTARSLGLDVMYYDVEQNYLDTRWKFIGTGVNTVD